MSVRCDIIVSAHVCFRWWGNQHHENSSICHTGLNLYISAVAIFVAVQVNCLGVMNVSRIPNPMRRIPNPMHDL